MPEQILTIVGLTALVMLSPGPDLVVVLRNTLAGGRGAGLATALGAVAGSLVHIGYCLVGIGLLISRSVVAFNVLKYAAALYLVWLGVSALRAGAVPPDAPASVDPTRRRGWFLQGFLNHLLNPKGALFYLGVFTVVVTPDTSAGTTAALVATMVGVSAAFWVLFVLTLDAAPVRRVLDRVRGAIDRALGVLLVALGVRVAFLER